MKRFPFDAKNPIGYLFACALEYLLFLNMTITAVCSLTDGIGISLFLISVASDIEINLNYISESVKMKQNQVEILKQLSELIQFHSNAKQLNIFIYLNYLNQVTISRINCDFFLDLLKMSMKSLDRYYCFFFCIAL